KMNEAPTAAPLGLAFVFARAQPDDYPALTKIATHDRTADPDAHWTVPDKIEALLLRERRQMVVADIAVALGCSVPTARHALNDDPRFLSFPAADGSRRHLWGLKAADRDG